MTHCNCKFECEGEATGSGNCRLDLSRSPGCSSQDEVIERLRGQLQNCVSHLSRANRHSVNGFYDDAIESANKALYETHRC